MTFSRAKYSADLSMKPPEFALSVAVVDTRRVLWGEVVGAVQCHLAGAEHWRY
jgi:hypothetical protein